MEEAAGSDDISNDTCLTFAPPFTNCFAKIGQWLKVENIANVGLRECEQFSEDFTYRRSMNDREWLQKAMSS